MTATEMISPNQLKPLIGTPVRPHGVDARFLEGGIEAFIKAGGETEAK